MNVPWVQAKGHLKRLDYPNIGSSGNWDEWYEQAWQHLSAAGLTEVVKPMDLTLVNLKLVALCWLVHDFCASVEGNEWATVPRWNEWITELEIDPVVSALVLQSSNRQGHLLSEKCLKDPSELMEDEGGLWLMEVGGIQSRLWPQVIMNAAFQQRERIVDALISGFNGLLPLFESIFDCTGECKVSLTSPERIRGYQWIEECCGVITTGDPEVNLPDTHAEGSNGSL